MTAPSEHAVDVDTMTVVKVTSEVSEQLEDHTKYLHIFCPGCNGVLSRVLARIAEMWPNPILMVCGKRMTHDQIREANRNKYPLCELCNMIHQAATARGCCAACGQEVTGNLR